MLRLVTVMFEMAHHTLTHVSSKTTSPLSILLVAEFPGYPPHNLHDAAQSDVAYNPFSTLRT
jgi:hypothetical protein